ncbi:hypothetical protein LSAT2_019700 [Lamellibrachia satsuma]|nr:hypothetical protein LSAT2_019700 [Lamellibrachia satsuma]
MMAPCKRQLKATRHLICGSCSNWVDFVKSGCEKSWAEVQADSFSFECRGCTKMKELEEELEELRLLVVAMVGREQGGCASSSGGETLDDKVGKDTRDARESSPQPGRKLRGGKATGHRETERKETGRKGTGGKTTGVKERGVGETGGKEKGVGETGGKTTGVKERGVGETRAKEWEVGETGAKETGGKGSGQNVMEGIERKSYSAAVIEGVRKRARVFVGDSIVRKTDRVLNKGDDVVVCLSGAKIEAITERVKNIVSSEFSFPVKDHVTIGRQSNTLTLGAINLGSYYLRGSIAHLELHLTDLVSRRLSDAGLQQFSCPDMFKTIVMEACGKQFSDPEKVFNVQPKVTAEGHKQDETLDRLSNVLYLAGVSPMSFAAYLTRMTVAESSLPLRCFTQGRRYSPESFDPSVDVGLLGAHQTTVFPARCWVG